MIGPSASSSNSPAIVSQKKELEELKVVDVADPLKGAHLQDFIWLPMEDQPDSPGTPRVAIVDIVHGDQDSGPEVTFLTKSVTIRYLLSLIDGTYVAGSKATGVLYTILE